MNVYVYGIEITSDIEPLDEHLRRCGLYYDALIGIELKKRRRQNEARAKRRPRIAELEAQRGELNIAIDGKYQEIRDRRRKESGRRIAEFEAEGISRDKAQRRGAKRTRYADIEAEIEKLKERRRDIARELVCEYNAFEDDTAPDRKRYERERTIGSAKPGKESEVAALLDRVESLREQAIAAKRRKPDVRDRKRSAKKSKDTGAVDACAAELKSIDEQLDKCAEETKRIRERLGKLRGGTRHPSRSLINDPVLERMDGDPTVSADWKACASASQWAAKETAQVRSDSGLGPGGYLLVEKAVQSAIQKRSTSGQLPQKRGYEPDGYEQREGRIGVNFNGRIPASKLADNNHVVIDPLPADQWATRSKRRHAHTTGRLRLGWEDEQRTQGPVWCEFRMVKHRPLPPDAEVARACIVRRRIGRRYKYELHLTIESSQPKQRWTKHGFVQRMRGVGTVRVRRGWTQLPDERGLLVATWQGDDGKSGELVLASEYTDLQLPDALRGISDRLFDGAVDTLRMRLKRGDLPDWMRAATSGIAQWRRHSKMAALAFRWARDRLGDERVEELWKRWSETRLARWESKMQALISGGMSRRQAGKACADLKLDKLGIQAEVSASLGLTGDDTLAFWLELWRRKNAHMYEWEANARETAHRRRRERYRRFAVELSCLYGDVNLKTLPLDKIAERAAPDEDDESWEVSRKNRRYAAVSTLDEALKQAFGDGNRKDSERRTICT